MLKDNLKNLREQNKKSAKNLEKNTLNIAKDDNETVEDSGATDDELGDNIVEEQEDNEIQDSGLVDKRKVIIFFISVFDASRIF